MTKKVYKSGSVEMCEEAFNVVEFPVLHDAASRLIGDPAQQPEGLEDAAISDDKPMLLDPMEIEAIFRNAQMEAARIVEQAHSTTQTATQSILDDARAQAQEITRQAYLEGQARGYAEGAAAKVTQVEQLIASLEETVARIEGKQSGFIAQYESDLHWAALEVSSKVLHRMVERDQLELLETVKDAVEQVRGAAWIDVQLSAESGELIDRLRRELASISNLEITPSDLPEGSCIVDTEGLQLDASIDSQLANLKEYLQLMGN